MEALLAACGLQSADISNIASAVTNLNNKQQSSNTVLANISNIGQQKSEVVVAEEKRKKDLAPRLLVSQAEFDSISGYLKGRLTLDKVWMRNCHTTFTLSRQAISLTKFLILGKCGCRGAGGSRRAQQPTLGCAEIFDPKAIWG